MLTDHDVDRFLRATAKEPGVREAVYRRHLEMDREELSMDLIPPPDDADDRCPECGHLFCESQLALGSDRDAECCDCAFRYECETCFPKEQEGDE